MFTTLLFAYLLTSVSASILIFRKNLVAFARLAAIPVALGAYWLIRDHGLFIDSGFMRVILLAVLIQPFIFVMVGVFAASISLFKEEDRGSILRHIVFNKPYPEPVS